MNAFDEIEDNGAISFNELPISESLKKSLSEMKIENMTEIQRMTMFPLLNGKDLMGASETGSGKTLAFLVPLVDKLIRSELSVDLGVFMIVVSPTKELSRQIYETCVKLTKYTNYNISLCVGGNSKEEEENMFKEGVNILIATPGRLLDHLSSKSSFRRDYLQSLVIDEADKLLQKGFLVNMVRIIESLPRNRQTVLFSATLNINKAKLTSMYSKHTKLKLENARRIRQGLPELQSTSEPDIMESLEPNLKEPVEEKIVKLAFVSLKKDCVSVDLKSVINTNKKLRQHYGIYKDEAKFSSLYYFLNDIIKGDIDKPIDNIKDDNNKKVVETMKKSVQNEDKPIYKVVVFMSTCAEVNFYHKAFKSINLKTISIHSKLTLSERNSNVNRFKKSKSAIILATDVFCRGIDIPDVNWVIQYDPPDSVDEYIHRIGRTARAGKSGQSIIFLRHDEESFLRDIKEKGQRIYIHSRFRSLPNSEFNQCFINMVKSTEDMPELAADAYKSTITSYKNNQMKCFDVFLLDMKCLALTFGLAKPLKYNIGDIPKRYGKRTLEENCKIIKKKFKSN